MNTAGEADSKALLLGFSPGGYDDVLVFAPVAPVIELGDSVLAVDGCLNFFAGPENADFSARVNFYNLHYASTHFVGTSGGNVDDMLESIAMMNRGLLNPAILVTTSAASTR